MFYLTEKVGFEPTVPFGITGFQDQLLKPLGHLSLSLYPLYRPALIACLNFNSANMILAKHFSFVNSFF